MNAFEAAKKNDRAGDLQSAAGNFVQESEQKHEQQRYLHTG